jgi:hypothetical protein
MNCAWRSGAALLAVSARRVEADVARAAAAVRVEAMVLMT